jgi:hypothetical protein
MPVLRWSSRAIAVTTPEKRGLMTDLFHAFFRAGLPDANPPSLLPLDLPGEVPERYYFVAERVHEVWVADAKLRRPDLGIRFTAGIACRVRQR